MLRRFPLIAPLAAMLALAPGARAQGAIDTLALRAHTRFLAHDLLEGRGTGTRGERLAALYITSELERLGIPGAAPDGGYLQRVPIREATVDRDRTRLVLERAGRTSTFLASQHFIPSPTDPAAPGDFAGPALFAGTAGLARKALEGAALEGQVVVLLGTLGTEAATLLPDWQRRGARGVISVIQDPSRYSILARSYGASFASLAPPPGAPASPPSLPTVLAGPELAAALLEGAPLSPDALDGKRPFRALPLERSVEATLRVTVKDVMAANIAARIPGTDPRRAGEVVAYTAHYDHLGVGQPDATGDSIYNGFSDNAAGTAMLLAIADALRKEPPARSTLFLFFTGEEKGLLGSTYYASAPLVPLEQTAAVINLDAGAPPAPPKSWKAAGGSASTLGALAARVAERNGWTLDPVAASPNSDHWPFLERGVPGLFLIPGQLWEGVSREQKEALHQRWDRYHHPADEWHADFPFRGLQRYAELALQIGREAANATERPRTFPRAQR